MSFLAPVTVPANTVALVLTQQQPNTGDGGGQGDDFGKSSPVGFLLLLIFLIAVAFLVRSMTKHLKRVPASFDPEETEEQPGEGEAAVDAEPGATDSTEPAPRQREKSS
ncbi:hypothetical protein HFP15_27510 [Amycolatopsis sp. K13G38]|uniref:Preprotein translocase subunit SecG n=1 Tax=Amycolatopsis acididurans TaxID=2724524 RepID=A0ABX1JAV6_9PSEU|nr:hypothetical protein [Amycolatopsis acididurans]NKQ56629.1 hypothetical protein [Amycolatopsis acididurans]